MLARNSMQEHRYGQMAVGSMEPFHAFVQAATSADITSPPQYSDDLHAAPPYVMAKLKLLMSEAMTAMLIHKKNDATMGVVSTTAVPRASAGGATARLDARAAHVRVQLSKLRPHQPKRQPPLPQHPPRRRE
jgi:hypothetical protein